MYEVFLFVWKKLFLLYSLAVNLIEEGSWSDSGECS